MLRRAVTGLAAVLVLALTACAQGPSDPGAANLDSGPDTGTESTALGLVDLWRVSGAEGEDTDTWLRLDVPEFQLWRDCGMIQGSWRATDTLFVASTYGASGECVTGSTLPRLAWLESVIGYRAAGDSWELSDAQGAVVATLTLDGGPDPIPTAADFFTEPPVITDRMREGLRQPAPLPGGLTPATPEILAARWTPADHSGTTAPHVVFEADGTWTGSDGCNGGQGRWAADGTGAFLATPGISTLMACEGAPVPSWVTEARWAIIDNESLRLLDASAAELGRLERD
ncbi:META domain-containing protein [Cryobacterium glaciale]|uniref:META domain-containing protein n=1 Tax=Cryobacterium glaciale TaxID=1259145 RepID=A0A4R8UWA8_9MICO|nr:META domain-containing protein [Cryobacterium glaciale]TFB73320.1 META domain-containing protein [Cryobacterium glaciale]